MADGPDTRTVSPEEALREAAKRGDQASVETLIEQGVDVRSCDARGHTALYWACRWGHTEIARTLIAHDADPYFPNVLHNTPFMLAQMFKHDEIVQIILERNNDLPERSAKRHRHQ